MNSSISTMGVLFGAGRNTNGRTSPFTAEDLKIALRAYGYNHVRFNEGHEIFDKPGKGHFPLPCHKGNVSWPVVNSLKRLLGLNTKGLAKLVKGS